MNSNIKYITGFISFIITLFALSLDFYSSLGITLFIFIGTKFFLEIGTKIEIKDVIILIGTLQWIIGPVFAYKLYPNDEFYYMAVDINVYMSYTVPAAIALTLGLYFPLQKKSIDNNLYLVKISELLDKYKNIDLQLIAVGLFFNITLLMFPDSIQFAVKLVSDVRFVGLYILLIGNRKNKWLIISGVIFMLLLTALKYAMFHDLLLWLAFFMMIAAFVSKPTIKKKIIFLAVFIFFGVTIQTIKYAFREALSKGSGSGVSLFTDLVKDKVIEGNEISSEENLSAMVTRINQGWIIARIMSWTPLREPFAEGETIVEALKSSFMPRFLFPDKVKAGGRTYFFRFTGKMLSENTSMGLSLLGEAYANYGKFGGSVFMFIIGLFYNFFVFKIYQIAKKHPALIFFIPLLFLQVVKAETDFSVIINHLFKASIAVWIIFFGLKKAFNIRL